MIHFKSPPLYILQPLLMRPKKKISRMAPPATVAANRLWPPPDPKPWTTKTQNRSSIQCRNLSKLTKRVLSWAPRQWYLRSIHRWYKQPIPTNNQQLSLGRDRIPLGQQYHCHPLGQTTQSVEPTREWFLQQPNQSQQVHKIQVKPEAIPVKFVHIWWSEAWV